MFKSILSNGDSLWSNIGPNGEVIQYENNSIESNSSVYSDRMWQWNPEKFNSLSLKYFGDTGQHFYENRPIKLVESFLCEYLSKEIKLARITRHKNVSNGDSLWLFDYHEQKPVQEATEAVLKIETMERCDKVLGTILEPLILFQKVVDRKNSLDYLLQYKKENVCQ